VQIAKAAQCNNMRILFYFAPLPFQVCQHYLRNRFAERIQENTNTIKSVLRQEENDSLDLTFALPDSRQFTFPIEYIDEHPQKCNFHPSDRSNIASGESRVRFQRFTDFRFIKTSFSACESEEYHPFQNKT
jgi:hypothetical protein